MYNAPIPNYDYEVERLSRYYRDAVLSILRELDRIDLNDFQRQNAKSVLAEISRILSTLDKDASEWVRENLPKSAYEGVASTLVSLGIAETMTEAKSLAKFNQLNKNMIAAAIADTQADLLAITQNVERRVRSAVRQTVADVMRNNMTKGVNGRRTLKSEILEGLRKKLGKSVETGIIDAAGRRWKPETYAEVVVRTKYAEAYREATTNEAVSREAYYAVISRHGAKDACRFHEGRIMKLTADAPGNYPTYDELKSTGQIWHPNCKHTFSPIRTIDRLPQSVRELAEKQAEIGKKAVATGKRNPKLN